MINVVDTILSEKIRYIVNSPNLLRRLKVLLLLKYDKVKEVFSLSQEELDEFTNKVFNYKKLVELGNVYIVSYIEELDDKDMLDCYLNGADYTLSKYNIEFDKGKLLSKLIDVTLLDAISSKNLNNKINAVKTLSREINKPKDTNIVDEIANLFKDKEL